MLIMSSAQETIIPQASKQDNDRTSGEITLKLIAKWIGFTQAQYMGNSAVTNGEFSKQGQTLRIITETMQKIKITNERQKGNIEVYTSEMTITPQSKKTFNPHNEEELKEGTMDPAIGIAWANSEYMNPNDPGKVGIKGYTKIEWNVMCFMKAYIPTSIELERVWVGIFARYPDVLASKIKEIKNQYKRVLKCTNMDELEDEKEKNKNQMQ